MQSLGNVNIFICVAFTLSLINLQNAVVSGHMIDEIFNFKCWFCKHKVIQPKLDSHTTKPKITSSTTVVPTKCITESTTSAGNIINATDIPEILPTTEDIIKFFSSEITFKNLSSAGKISAFSLLCESDLIKSNQIPPTVIVNVITMIVTSNDLYLQITNDLKKFDSVLKMITNYPCVLSSLNTHVQIQLLGCFLSLPPYILISIPKSTFLSILGMITSPDVLTTLPHKAYLNLITTLSLSKPIFNCLQEQTLVSLLKFLVKSSNLGMIQSLPPSTLFGFYEGLFDRLYFDFSDYEKSILPKSVVVQILSPIMNSRILSVLPIGMYDNLLKVIGSNEYWKDIPTSNFVSLFTTLNKSPKILSSLNPYYLSEVIVAVQYLIPTSLFDELEISISCYLPSAQNFIYNKSTTPVKST